MNSFLGNILLSTSNSEAIEHHRSVYSAVLIPPYRQCVYKHSTLNIIFNLDAKQSQNRVDFSSSQPEILTES